MVVADRILGLDKLAETTAILRKQGKRIVHCHGVFDLLHIGHIRYLQAARKLADVLIVTVTADEHVNKGPDRPAFGQALRAEAIAALDCVDYVAINAWPTAVETIELLKPDIFAKGAEFKDEGSDPTGAITRERQWSEAPGSAVRVSSTAPVTSLGR